MPSFADALLVVVIAAYLFLAPFTKVEESFNIQAIHDILYHGLDINKYDHMEFPGVVPRTFIGSVFLSLILKPILHYLPKTVSKLDGQLLARGILGVINALAIVNLKDAAFKAIKQGITSTRANNATKKTIKKAKQEQPKEVYNPWSFGLWFALLQFSQFHIPFYASRTLPNFFALPLTNYAFAQLLNDDPASAVTILAFTTVVFRIEIVLLLLTTGLCLLSYKKLTTQQLIVSSIKGAAIGCLLSAGIDSFFWGRFTVPELESLFFNVVLGKSSEWGTEPYTKYFTKYLLSIFLPPYIPALAILGYFKDPSSNLLKILFQSSLSYIILISFQPHKEWRFIIYTVPIITLLGANGCSLITSRAAKSYLYKFYVIFIFGFATLSMVLSALWGQVSGYNYPGGFALTRFHEKVIMKKITNRLPSDNVKVHIDNLACISGVTHFAELNELANFTVTYDKTENLSDLTDKWQTFDYLISEIDMSKNYKGDVIPFLEDWRWLKVDTVKGFDGIDVKGFRSFDPINAVLNSFHQKSIAPIGKALSPFIHQKEMLYIYERVPAPKEQAGEK